MADESGQSHEASKEERLTARRVLRARRWRAPAKRAPWGWLGALIAIPLAAAALLLRPTQAPAEAPPLPSERAARAPARTQSVVPAQTEPAPVATEHTADRAAPVPAEEPDAQMLSDWLRVHAAPGANAVNVVDATTEGPFDIRAGDIIVDLCDRPGDETALEISAALADGGSACLMIRRGDEVVRAVRRSAPGDAEGPSL